MQGFGGPNCKQTSSRYFEHSKAHTHTTYSGDIVLYTELCGGLRVHPEFTSKAPLTQLTCYDVAHCATTPHKQIGSPFEKFHILSTIRLDKLGEFKGNVNLSQPSP